MGPEQGERLGGRAHVPENFDQAPGLQFVLDVERRDLNQPEAGDATGDKVSECPVPSNRNSSVRWLNDDANLTI